MLQNIESTEETVLSLMLVFAMLSWPDQAVLTTELNGVFA
jgi:hypothetical protein